MNDQNVDLPPLNLPGGPSTASDEPSGAPPSSNPLPHEPLALSSAPLTSSAPPAVPELTQNPPVKPKLSQTKDERKATTTENLKEEIKMVGISSCGHYVRMCAGNRYRVRSASRESGLFVCMCIAIPLKPIANLQYLRLSGYSIGTV